MQTYKQAYTLWPHQNEALEWMRAVEAAPSNADVKGGVVGLSMGLGKTLIALHHCLTDDNKPSLIVTKKPILDEWVSGGVRKFFSGKKVLVLDRKASDCDVADKHDIVITTYSYCTRAYQTDRPIMSRNWRRVVFDESHVMAKRTSLVFKAAKTIATNAKFVWCMTGTPLCNKNTDLKIQLEVCGYPFNKKRRWSLKLDDLEKHVMFMESDHDTSGVKKAQTVIHRVDMTPAQRTLYTKTIDKTIEQTAAVDIYEKAAHHKKLGYLGGMITKLRQISIGSEMMGVKDRNNKVLKVLEIAKSIHNPVTIPSLQTMCLHKLDIETKASVFKNLSFPTYSPTPDDTHHKMVVFTSFRKSTDLIRKTLDAKLPYFKYNVIDGTVKNKSEVIDNFKKDPSVSCLFMNYKVGSEGLNITNASVVVLFDPWWNDAVHNQAIARALRPGQKKRVMIHQLITKDSIEEQMVKLCEAKRLLRVTCFEGDQPNQPKFFLTLGVLKEQNERAQVVPKIEDE